MTGPRLLDLTLPSPAHNLACDEALLDELEAGLGEPTLRFWESPVPFVVLGYANRIDTEVNRAACARLGIPILRRSSGGGAVLQGPGCLNYNLSLPITADTAGITDANCHIMRRHRDALAKLLGREVQIQGHTDLTLGALKFSGNSQRRKRRALLFHGCFLLNFHLPLIDELLLHPSREPDYRAHRPHRQFLVNLNIPADSLKSALAAAWAASATATLPSPVRIDPLVIERYSNPAWNHKF